MKNPRMKLVAAAFATLGCTALLLQIGKVNAAAASPAAVNAPPTSALNGPQFGLDSQCVSNVPRAWGQYRGGSSQSGLAFEASDGTLRFVTNLPCGATPIIALEVRRTPVPSGN